MATNRLITISPTNIYIGTTTNVGNTYTVGSPPVGGYVTNILYDCTFNAGNTSTATLDGHTLLRNGVALSGGEIATNSDVLLRFDGVNFELMNYATTPGVPGHGSTTTTAAPTLVSGNWRFTVADTTAFNAFGLPIYCGDSTNSIHGTVYNVLSSTQLDIAPDSTSGTVSAITNGSTFTFSGVAGTPGVVTSLTTTGTSGPATLSSGVLNIPQYSGGGSGLTYVAKSSAYTVTTSDGNKFFDCTGTFPLSLPSASSAGSSFGLEIFNSGTGWVTVLCNGSDTMLGMFGAIKRYRLDPGMGIKIICTGAGWEIRGRMHTLIPPCELFLASYTKGGIYMLADFSTLFQDTAGTTPVTATGQNIKLMKDVSGLGNDFSQSSSTSCPVLAQAPGGNYYADYYASSLLRYMDAVGGAVFSCDSFTVATAVYYTAPASALRVVDTRGVGSAGAVKGWYVSARNGTSTLVVADDGAGNYSVLNDLNFFPSTNTGPLVFSYGNPAPGRICYRAAFSGVGGVTDAVQSVSGGTGAPTSITSTNTSRIGAEVGGTTQPFRGRLFGLCVLPAKTPLGAGMEALYNYYLNVCNPQ